tara:strand:- start:82 stop:843 length:762 start_codon:yes stop_codon:yes gene_type:complete
LNNLEFKNIAEDLLDTFLEAGEVAKKISNKGVKITIKADKSPVTDGDLKVDLILRNKIKKLTKEIPIISEETVNLEIKNKYKTFWLIDPIDGTKDYIKKKSEYTLNAALIVNYEPAIGIVYAPAKRRLFYSYGKGFAYEINSSKKNLSCKSRNDKKVIALANSDQTPAEILDIYKKNKVTEIVRMSSSLKFCILAAGEADIYAATARAYEWDIAAGHAILEHSGGIITTHEGKKFLYGKENYKNLPLIAKRSN